MKAFYFDLETTGTKFWKNGIHQISGLIEIDGEIKERFDFKVRPFKDAVIELDALKVAGVTPEQVREYPLMNDVYEQIVAMLAKYVDKFNNKDKFHLIGYNNASFDNQFFRAFFTQNAKTEKEAQYGNYFGSWFWADSIDVLVLASEYLKDCRASLPDFQLKTVAKFLNIDVDVTKLHDAQYDIDLTRQIYKLVTFKP